VIEHGRVNFAFESHAGAAIIDPCDPAHRRVYAADFHGYAIADLGKTGACPEFAAGLGYVEHIDENLARIHPASDEYAKRTASCGAMIFAMFGFGMRGHGWTVTPKR